MRVNPTLLYPKGQERKKRLGQDVGMTGFHGGQATWGELPMYPLVISLLAVVGIGRCYKPFIAASAIGGPERPS